MEATSLPMDEDLFERPSGRPVIRLPPLTAGVINITALTQLQDELEVTKRALKAAEEKLEADLTDEQVKELMQGFSNRSMKLRSIMNDSINKEVEVRTQGLKETLEARNDKGAKLRDLKNFANSFKLSTPVPADVIGVIAKDPAKQVQLQEKAKRNAEESRRDFIQLTNGEKELSDAQVRELLASNPTVKAIIAANIKKKVEQTVGDRIRQLESEYEEKLRAERMETQRAMMLGKRSDVLFARVQQELKLAEAKLAKVQSCYTQSPGMQAQHLWKKVCAVTYPEITPRSLAQAIRNPVSMSPPTIKPFSGAGRQQSTEHHSLQSTTTPRRVPRDSAVALARQELVEPKVPTPLSFPVGPASTRPTTARRFPGGPSLPNFRVWRDRSAGLLDESDYNNSVKAGEKRPFKGNNENELPNKRPRGDGTREPRN